MADKKIQKQKVLEYMETHGSIDGWTAVTELHIMRLPARISELKDDGVPIKKVMKASEDGSTRYAVYSIAG